MPTDILDATAWEVNWHGTYFYTLWAALKQGLRCGGIPGEGGDNHVSGGEFVYTTPNPRLAYGYACPHQLFGNGFLMRVVLDVRVRRRFMARQFNPMHHNWETLYNPAHTRVAGFWLFVDTHAESGDSRILEWDPMMETIPQFAVDQWVAERRDPGMTVPRVITDPNPMFPPLDNAS